MFREQTCRPIGVSGADRTDDCMMFGPGAIPRPLVAHIQPACPGEASHRVADAAMQEHVAGQAGEFDVKIRTDAMPFLA